MFLITLKIPLVIVTSDKVYENLNEKNKKILRASLLDGNCPYSLSKVICELLSNSYTMVINDIKIRTVRGGNVIGGGDWSQNRIVPDLVKSLILIKKLLLLETQNIQGLGAIF